MTTKEIWYQKNREAIRAKAKAYYDANRSHILARQKAAKQKKKMQQAEVLLAATEVVAHEARQQMKESKNVSPNHSEASDVAVKSRNATKHVVSRRVPPNASSGEYSTSSIVLGRRAEAARRICAEEGIQAQSVREVIVEINGVRFIYIKE